MDTLLSTIILVTFLVTIIMAIGSYAAYKLREARRPGIEESASGEESVFYERILADDDGAPGA
jgi:hypothetical protein